jgi:hypothetical protein
MPVGLRVPVGVSPSGGASLVDKEDENRKIIKLALSSCYNENAFQQDIGLGEECVFDLSDTALRAKIQRRLTKIFAEFTIQKRFKLITNSIKWSEDATSQELTLDFRYYDMEADEEKAISQSYSASGGA